MREFPGHQEASVNFIGSDEEDTLFWEPLAIACDVEFLT